MKKISPQLRLEILRKFEKKFVKTFNKLEEEKEKSKADDILDKVKESNN
ncbi:hypothetical protein ACFL2V_08325 [Pseudomonadota bacterium]